MVSIPACHAGDPGSISGNRALFLPFLFHSVSLFFSSSQAHNIDIGLFTLVPRFICSLIHQLLRPRRILNDFKFLTLSSFCYFVVVVFAIKFYHINKTKKQLLIILNSRCLITSIVVWYDTIPFEEPDDILDYISNTIKRLSIGVDFSKKRLV